jgi:hypothetical protein
LNSTCHFSHLQRSECSNLFKTKNQERKKERKKN